MSKLRRTERASGAGQESSVGDKSAGGKKDGKADTDPNFGPGQADIDPNFGPSAPGKGPKNIYDAYNQYQHEHDSPKCPQQRWGDWEAEQSRHGERAKEHLRHRFDEYQKNFSSNSGGSGRGWQNQHWGESGGAKSSGFYNRDGSKRDDNSSIRTTQWGFSLYRHVNPEVGLESLSLQQQVEHRVGEWQHDKQLQDLLRTLPDIFPSMEVAESTTTNTPSGQSEGTQGSQEQVSSQKATNVKRQFMQAMRKIHPDKQPKDATEEQRSLAKLLSSIITGAYQNRDSA
jgi:hypothetical protein